MKAKQDYKIFVLDGDMFSLNIYEQHLINLGYSDISIFHDVIEFYDSLTLHPDIVFLDHGINFANGVDILKKIKNFNPDIYVVFIAEGDDVQLVISSLKHGAFDFIVRGENDVMTMESVIARILRVKKMFQSNTDAEIFKRHR
ncbi:MAG: response regulator [Ferruginibacter sp.]